MTPPPEPQETRWIEDGTLEAPEGHKWMKPAPAECLNCQCHTARVCDQSLWDVATPPRNADGTLYTALCPCRRAHVGLRVLADDNKEPEE